MTHCKHDIPRDQPCSQCANDFAQQRADAYTQGFSGYIGSAGYGTPAIHPQVATRLCDPGSGLLLTNQPVPASGHAADAGEGAAIEAGIWLVTLYNKKGKPGFYPVLASDIRAEEMLNAGFEMSEVTDLNDALMAAESQGGSAQ